MENFAFELIERYASDAQNFTGSHESYMDYKMYRASFLENGERVDIIYSYDCNDKSPDQIRIRNKHGWLNFTKAGSDCVLTSMNLLSYPSVADLIAAFPKNSQVEFTFAKPTMMPDSPRLICKK